jgi:hypothetical protein
MFIVLDDALCSLVENERRLKGLFCLHHQGDEGFGLLVAQVRTWNRAAWLL